MKNPINIRLLSQQLAAPQFTRPEEVVAHFGAMQAQEYRMMRWAVAMRTKRPSAAAFTHAFNDGRIVRLHLLRGTWQLVSATDYWWMHSLCAPKARQVISGWMSANKISLPEDEMMTIRGILVDTLERLGSATKEDFELALAERGMTMDPHRLSYHIRYAELDAVLCSGDLLPMKASYSLCSAKLDAPKEMERDEALMLLAVKYLQSHQPVTLEDFVWWSGLGVNDCRRAISLLGNRVHIERFPAAGTSPARDFLILDNVRTRGCRSGQSLLIAPYDEYLIGYKSRDLVLAPEHKHHAHNNSGIFQPVIAQDGRICGNWSPFHSGPEFSFFGSNAPDSPLESAWEEYRRYSESATPNKRSK